jgi:hypothetical protein
VSNQDFINSIKDGAIKAQSQYGICASMTMAQAILESGYGRYAPGNNLFGIKWTSGCGYRSHTLSTKECYNGVWQTIQAAFRVYNSLADSLLDHAKFLVENSRYANLRGVTDYRQACKLIQEDGYATDPNYTTQLINIIESNNLNQYDSDLISITSNAKLKAQIAALQYNLNLDYNAKLKNVDGNIYKETLDNLESVGKLIGKGHKSHVVQWIQQKLIQWGFLSKGQDTSVYDEPTFQAVTNLQKCWGRETSGKILISNNTWQIFLNN